MPDGGKYRIYNSDTITSVDLSCVGILSPKFSDDAASICNLFATLEVGAVPVVHCPGFDFMFFAQQGGVELQRIKDFVRINLDFPVIGYDASPPMDAAGTCYSIFKHDIRAAYIQWRMGVEQAYVAHHINARHVLLFIKVLYEQVLRGHPQGHQLLILKLRQLYAGCNKKPSEKRAEAMVNFVKYVPFCALMRMSCSDTEGVVLSQRVLDKSWKRARFTDDMACNLLDGLTRLRMSERYFTTIFEAYKAKEQASGEQAAAIVRFERELSGGAGPFSEDGIASGNPCSAFALFSECRANDMVDGSQDDGTLGDLWDGLSAEVKGIYAAVATTIVAGQPIRDLKTKVEVQRTQQAQAHAPERGVPSGQQPQVLAFFLFSLSCSQ